MKYSAVLLAAGALLVSAMPLDKRALEVQWVTDIVTVTVTVDPSALTNPSPLLTDKGEYYYSPRLLRQY